ncbi:TPA: hypothetical protein DCQ44_02600 [Candidatus Taylorbacteria bacterium]|nr:hypothetical protein [Candidatus Taylorbacteria bacterium]
MKKLQRSSTDKVIAGVCGGIAKYLEIDSTLVRIIFILLALMGGSGILLYLILALIIPSENSMQPVDFAVNASEVIKSAADNIKQQIRNKEDSHGWHLFFGLVLVFIGVISLAKAVFPEIAIFPPFNIFWPLVLLFIGLYIIVRHRNK